MARKSKKEKLEAVYNSYFNTPSTTVSKRKVGRPRKDSTKLVSTPAKKYLAYKSPSAISDIITFLNSHVNSWYTTENLITALGKSISASTIRTTLSLYCKQAESANKEPLLKRVAIKGTYYYTSLSTTKDITSSGTSTKKSVSILERIKNCLSALFS